jgi:hypothetical protein
MTEDEWVRYLDTLPGDMADMCRHIIERCASVIASEQLRHLGSEDTEQAERIAGDTELRRTANSDRMLIEDQGGRISTLEEGEATAPHTD